MPIRGLSFDFDGCLFNYSYAMSSGKDVIAHNRSLLNAIKQQNESYSKVVSFIGSARQDEATDTYNSPHKGSCFPAMLRVNR